MLLCDCCQQGWHMQCLQDPLDVVPEGDWYCVRCTAAAEASGGFGEISSTEPLAIHVGENRLKWVQEFRYLGSILSADGSLDPELKRRSHLATAAFHRLSSCLLLQRGISLGVKMKVYKAIVSQILLYGSQCWALTTTQMQQLEVLQHNHLRRILGVRRSDRLSNAEILERCKQPTVEEQVLRRRGHWIGHMLRMGDDRVVKQLLFSSLPGRGRQGGQFQTLLRCYQLDLQKVLSNRQRSRVSDVALDRDAWKKLFESDAEKRNTQF